VYFIKCKYCFIKKYFYFNIFCKNFYYVFSYFWCQCKYSCEWTGALNINQLTLQKCTTAMSCNNGSKWKFVKAAIAQTKPLNPSIDESINEIDHDNAKLQKNPSGSKKQQRNSALPTNEVSIKATTQTDTTNSAAGTMIDTTVQSVSVSL